ncbi:MAG: zinc ribbon domain-containing protein [Chloroflexi bacterium]|nr:zinc ribbon domain-containing protein [Chloroflexota bacterium]
MRCAQCGTVLPDEANYCFHCGARQPQASANAPDAEAAASAPEYEYCDLHFVNRLYGVYYEARQGRAVIARSADGLPTRREAHENLLARLSAQGWEADPDRSDDVGYAARLRRAASARSAP